MRLLTKRSPPWPATSPPATSTSTSSSRWTTPPPSYASSATRRCSQLFQVFSGQVGGGKQPHLANFYLILPPLGSRLENQCFQFTMCKKNILTILAAVNYIEHLTGAKEKIFKKVRSLLIIRSPSVWHIVPCQNLEGACFTEDGFSMGLAYCLTLLNQWREADSLHWWGLSDTDYDCG